MLFINRGNAAEFVYVPSEPETGRRKLLMAITELDVGGAEKAFVQIASGLARSGWDVAAISLRDRGPLASQLETAGVPVTALNCHRRFDPRSVLRLRSKLREFRPQVLMTFLHEANIAGRLAALWAGIPLVVSGIRVADRRAAVVIPERLTRCCVDLYIAVSDDVAKTHSDLCHIRSHRMKVIRNGVDVQAIIATPPVHRISIGAEASDFLFLSAGRLTEQKAPLDLLRAFAELPQTLRQRARLIYVGDGPLRNQLQTEIESAGLEYRVQLLGWREDLIGIMKAADRLVLASRWEGLPNVMLESAAAGLPVIAADVDGVRDLADTGLSITRFNPGNSSQLAQRMAEAMGCSASAIRRGMESQVVPGKLVTWNDVVRKYDRVLGDALSCRVKQDS